MQCLFRVFVLPRESLAYTSVTVPLCVVCIMHKQYEQCVKLFVSISAFSSSCFPELDDDWVRGTDFTEGLSGKTASSPPTCVCVTDMIPEDLATTKSLSDDCITLLTLLIRDIR